MNSLSSPASDPSRHRRYKPSSPPSAPLLPSSAPEASLPDVHAPPAFSAPPATPDTFGQNDLAHLAQLEERLAAAERTLSDLAGQIREMR